MRNIVKVSVGIIVGMSLCSCSRFQDSTPSYMTDAGQAKALTIPQGASAPKKASIYVAPTSDSSSDQPVSIIPPGSRISQYQAEKKKASASPKQSAVSLAMSASEQTLLVPMTPKAAWPSLAQALQASDMPILKSDASMHSYAVVDVAKTGMHLTKQSPVYTFSLAPTSKGSALSVVSSSGSSLSSAQVTQLLTTVKQHWVA